MFEMGCLKWIVWYGWFDVCCFWSDVFYNKYTKLLEKLNLGRKKLNVYPLVICILLKITIVVRNQIGNFFLFGLFSYLCSVNHTLLVFFWPGSEKESNQKTLDMMKHRVFLAAVLLTALAFSQSAKAYDFSAVAPSGQTLYYNIVGGNAQVTSQNSRSPYYSTYPTGALTIPDSVTYNGTTYSVTTIGNFAFNNCSGLTSVTIGGSVTTIGNYAFDRCSGLTSVTIGGSVTTIGYNAFYMCRGLTSVTIPNSVTSIGNYAFMDCSGLTSVTIGDSVTTIGNFAFMDCSGLTSVTIGGSVTTIGTNAFYLCSSLSSVTIPNSVTTIGGSAFNGCSGLTSVTIGGSVTTIADQAFANCNGMTEITCLATGAPTLGNNVFYNVPSTIPVYIPCGSQSSYASSWRYFSNFNEIFLPTLTAQSSDTTMGTVAITTSPTCSDSIAVVTATANSGYLFDHWSDGSTSNPYTFTVTSDTTVIAYFVREEEPEGITDINKENVSVYVRDGRIVVTGAEGESVQVCDITGRPVPDHSPLSSGVYMVKVGNLPVRKVVVTR